MNGALRRLALVTFAALLCALIAWFLVRRNGLQRPLLEASTHPFLKDLKIGSGGVSGSVSGRANIYRIAYRGIKEFPENTLLGFDEAVAVNADAVLWADVRPSADNELFLYRDIELSKLTEGHGWIGYTPASEIRKLNAGFKYKDKDGANPFLQKKVSIPTLAEFLSRYPKRRLILNFCDNRPGLQEKIIDVVDRFHAGDRVLIQSDQEGLLKDLREKKPEWLFGSSLIRSTQLRMLASVGLASVAPLKGDVYVTEVQVSGNNMLTEPMLKELLRRKLVVFAGPVNDQPQARKLIQSGVSGLMTEVREILQSPANLDDKEGGRRQ